ncbi:hypothetical protein LCGC14_1993780, partial [marine sediment metagenome]
MRSVDFQSFVVAAVLVLAAGPEALADYPQRHKLTASDAAVADLFGMRSALSGSRAIVGAHLNDDAGDASGSAYVFDVRTGRELAKLTASDAEAHDLFGRAVGISGDDAVVGAPGDYQADGGSGSAYVFASNGDGWDEVVKLTATDPLQVESFGYAVSISGDRLVAGAPGGYGVRNNTGTAYVFERAGATWTQAAKLIAPDGGYGDSFGYAAAISGDTIIVGARYHAGGGSAYFFERDPTGWAQVAQFSRGGSRGNDYGVTVAISGNYAIVGKPGYRDNGSVYIYERLPGGWTE